MPKQKERGARKARSSRRGLTLEDIMEMQRSEFVAKFGREPRPGDPVLFDPDEDSPKPMPPNKLTAGMVVSMIQAGIPNHLIYAYIRTDGLILTDETLKKASAKDRADWKRAMAEYEKEFG